MKYLSLFDGIGAAHVAWGPLGWRCVGASEIDRFPIAVVRHHKPDIPELGDVNKYHDWNIEAPDLVCGGSPCQSFSIAGLRKGMADPRGNLALVFLGAVDHFRSRWMVWENVPGVLSSNGGRDFGAVLFREHEREIYGAVSLSASCPYGAPGDHLWVRETWDCVHYQGIDAAPTYFYRADETDPERDALIRWRPSIHMPRTASRITLEITDVRVERLQHISEDDARAEGVGEGPQEGMVTGPVVAFADLWDSIHGPDAWLKNPWVWVVEFRRAADTRP